MARTYRALAALLSYPTKALQAATAEIAAVLAEKDIVPAPVGPPSVRCSDEIAGLDIYDLQERYFALFDRSRTLSLHLFEHIHGESRDRGQAMADLVSLYARHGLEMTVGELPYFLPLFLEFLSQLPDAEARAMLAEPAGILRALTDRLASATPPTSPSWLRSPNSRRHRSSAPQPSRRRAQTTSRRWTRPGKKQPSASAPAKRWTVAARTGCILACVQRHTTCCGVPARDTIAA